MLTRLQMSILQPEQNFFALNRISLNGWLFHKRQVKMMTNVFTKHYQ